MYSLYEADIQCFHQTCHDLCSNVHASLRKWLVMSVPTCLRGGSVGAQAEFLRRLASWLVGNGCLPGLQLWSDIVRKSIPSGRNTGLAAPEAGTLPSPSFCMAVSCCVVKFGLANASASVEGEVAAPSSKDPVRLQGERWCSPLPCSPRRGKSLPLDRQHRLPAPAVREPRDLSSLLWHCFATEPAACYRESARNVGMDS